MEQQESAEWLAARGRAALAMMIKIREFESRLPGYAKAGLIRGSTHPSVGMEAIAVGVSEHLREDDKIVSNHRGHAHCLAKGADLGRTLAEIFGRQAGYCLGKGGSMHIAVAPLGILGTNGIVGASIGLAVGAALSAQVKGTDEVAVAYFGDGATNQGVLAEAFNLAALWRLPVLFVCENNHFAQSASFDAMMANPDLRGRGEAYGVRSVDVDGMRAEAVSAAADAAVADARSGRGPTFIVADTYRYLGHMADDTEIYRTRQEVAAAQGRDPIAALAARLTGAGLLDVAGLDSLRSDATDAVDAAYAFAVSSPPADRSLAFTDVEGPAA